MTTQLATGNLFHFASQPSQVFRVTGTYLAAGFIPSVSGVTLDGRYHTNARAADVVALAVNARFWFCFDEFARLTLTPRQELHYTSGGGTEEGYDVTEYTLSYDGEFVTVSVDRDARDCDGRMSEYREIECHVSRLNADWNKYAAAYTPVWQPVSNRRRDYSAEAAGY